LQLNYCLCGNLENWTQKCAFSQCQSKKKKRGRQRVDETNFHNELK
jgi:hypothetical protein